MNRCRICIYPDTRPDAHFVDGVCSGCRSHHASYEIDWPARKAALKNLIAEAKARNAPYDVVVPVSGGKDSTYQVLIMLEAGAKVLAVNGATDMQSELGRRNLDNLKRHCDVIEWTPNIEVRKKLVRLGLRMVGDMSWPEHLSIWSLPTKIAVQMRIPLVVWGEQPQREYATPEGVVPATRLNSRWVAEFGGMNGLRLPDLVGLEGLTERDLDVFRFPADADLEAANVQGIWLGDYIPWDGWKNSFIAQSFGFETYAHAVENSLANYENLDNYVTILRDWLRFMKFGYTRGTDIACNHVRRGRLTREEALRLEGLCVTFPKTSLGKPIEDVLAYFGLTLAEFQDECARWMNPNVFFCLKEDGTPVLNPDARSSHYPLAAE